MWSRIPNALSILRFLLTPLTLALIFQSRYWEALLVHAISGSSDFADGFIARWFGCETRLGSFLDAASDKIYTLSIFCTLTYLGRCPTWYLALLITVSWLQSTAVLLLHWKNRSRLAPNWIGKLCMTLQFIWAGAQLLDLSVGYLTSTVSLLGYCLLAGLLVMTFVKYFLQSRNRLLPIASPHLGA